jgi:hypothetical protein
MRCLSGFLSSYRSPEPASSRLILLWRSSSSEFLRFDLLPASFDASSTYPGSLPSSRHHRSASTFAKVAMPSLRSVLRFSQPLDGFLRPPASQACFIPRATSRVIAVQGLLSPRSRALSSRAASSLPLSSRALTGLLLDRSHTRPACRRMPRSEHLDFEAFLRARQRCVRFGISLPAARSPLRFSSPPGRKPPPWFRLPKTPRSRRSSSSAYFSGGLGLTVSRETNLPETFEPSD